MKAAMRYGMRFILLFLMLVVLLDAWRVTPVFQHRLLTVESYLNRAVFLDPGFSQDKTIYIQSKNASSLIPVLSQALQRRGYHLVGRALEAHYILQLKILSFQKEMHVKTQQGYYIPVLLNGLSGAFSAAISGGVHGVFVRMLAGGFIGLSTDMLLRDTHYTMMTDIQILERNAHRIDRHRARITSHANKVNLSDRTARSVLQSALVHVLVQQVF